VGLQAAGLAAGAAGVGHGDGGECEIDGGERESERERESSVVCERENGGRRLRGINRGACGAHVWNLKLKLFNRLGSFRFGSARLVGFGL